MNSKVIKIWAVVIGALIVIGALSAFFSGGPKQNVPIQTVKAYEVPVTLGQSAAFGTDTLVFSNGQNLASYNYANGQVQILGPSSSGVGTINSLSVSQDNQYVLFHDQKVVAGGALAAELQSQGQNPALDYWWLFDTQTASFTPLPQGIVMAKIDGDNVYAVAISSAGETLTTYSTPGLQAISSINIIGSTNFFVAKNGFLLETPDNTILLTSDGIVNHQLLQTTIPVGVSSDKQELLAVSGQQTSQSFIAFNLQTNKTSTIASNITVQPVWLNTDEAVYIATDPNTNAQALYSYDSQTHKSALWNTNGQVSSIVTSGATLSSLDGPSTAVLSNSKGTKFYIVGTKLATPDIAELQSQ